MAAKKTTKKSTKKVSKATKKAPAKKATEKVVKEAPKKDDETVTIKTNYLYAGIIAVGVIIIAIFLINMDFSASANIDGIVIVNDANCINCRTEQVKGALQQLFPDTEIQEIDASTSEAQNLLNLGVPALPAYFFSKDLEQSSGFLEIESQLPEAFIQANGVYYLHPAIISPGKLLTEVDIEGARVLGKDNAPVTIIEFSDFECPYCKRFYSDTYEALKEQYIDTGKAKLVFKHFPLPIHSQALPAAQAAECAGEQGNFWNMHDKLFENQDSLSTENYKKWAADLGLDTEQFNKCYDSGKYTDKINSDLEQGTNAYIGGTPSFIVNGQIIVGAQPISAFAQLIG